MTNGDYGRKWLPTHRPHVRYRDLSDELVHSIASNEHGWTEFEGPSGNTPVWVEETKTQRLNR